MIIATSMLFIVLVTLLLGVLYWEERVSTRARQRAASVSNTHDSHPSG